VATSDINNELKEKARHFIDEPLELHLNYMYMYMYVHVCTCMYMYNDHPRDPKILPDVTLSRCSEVIKVQNGTSKWSLFKGGRYLRFGCTYLLKYYLYFSLGRIEWRESG